MIAAAFGGHPALKNAIGNRRIDPNPAIRHFNDQLPLVKQDQHINRIVRQGGALGRFNGVIQQVADDGDQLRFCQPRQGRSMRLNGSKFSSTPFSRARAALPSSRPQMVGEVKREEIKSSSS